MISEMNYRWNDVKEVERIMNMIDIHLNHNKLLLTQTESINIRAR